KLTHGLETTLKYLQDTKKTRQELLFVASGRV
ncbi:hypothetical protein F442_03007, partial [Phytophthora nicotianae P10297]